VTEASWSTLEGRHCLRVHGAGGGAHLAVWPASALASGTAPPPAAGEVVADGADLCFVPRFEFVEGTVYAVVVDDAPVAELVRHRAPRRATTEVLGIDPAVDQVPRNLLRLYVRFSARMSEGQSSSHLRLVDDAGQTLPYALLVVDDELWDGDRRRLTVLLDPARIKRGLVAHDTLGYPLEVGAAFRVVVDGAFLDATGTPLRGGASRRFEVGPDERRRVDPLAWSLTVPVAGSDQALRVVFDRPLDVALVARCLTVATVATGGHRVEGTGAVAPDGGSWSFVPHRPWGHEVQAIVVDEILEDLAGNSVRRVFDHDLDAGPPSGPSQGGHAVVRFVPAPP